MQIKIFQKGFNYSQDGDGNRLVYHLQGCNMRCPWCANPEGIAKEGTLLVNSECLLDTLCPFGAIDHKQLDRCLCKKCRTHECIMLHKTKGIRLSCETPNIDNILEEVTRSSTLFYDGGGVTLSGGEATLQFEGVSILLKRLKDLGIHTAIETNGTHPKLATLFPFIDLLIMDFKHYDEEVHARITGIGNVIIKENIKKAMTNHPNVLMRIPVIKGFNDLEKDIRNFITFFKQYDTTHTRFEFLAYHEYGKTKWEQCGMSYEMKDAYVDAQTMALYESLFKENNFIVVHT